ncbi:4906_t:CDS:1 [Diversispora eburnea]|uniref:4906_t:CDS:1 n=1 Tax=Diversispora eburnea TaxID=1213867 RepID=A0A9N8ZAP9_9GLOM|nr:4906_t:CDS:1 [Diversispora eburnea]
MDLQTRADNLLGNLNINLIHVPPTIEEVINYYSNVKKYPTRKRGRNEDCTGFKIFKINVANHSRILGENNHFIISNVSNLLWKHSQPWQRILYTDMAKRLKALME